ncbi:MAG: ABC transporter permease [Thermoanaerobaculia bacterium]|nr:ABC transporter permease [Thermoanaerobaculia bacterium]
MILHLLRLAWNRKGANALVIIEIFVAFLVTFAVAALGLFLWDNQRRPLGYQWQNVYAVNLETGDGRAGDDDWSADQVETLRRVLIEAKRLEGVDSTAAVLTVPFEMGGSTRTWENLRMQVNEVTDEFLEVMELELVAGRWFGPEDDGREVEPIVIDRDLARAAFGDADPVGQRLPGEPDEGGHRIVGVVNDFREDGELSSATNYVFERKALNPESRLLRKLVVRAAPEVPPDFEEQLITTLRGVAPGWSFEVRSLEGMRRISRNFRLAPLVLSGVVGLFLLSMVGLGLIGVLWQNVTRRTRELGLRRAVGADRGRIYRQILAELFLVTTTGLLFGLLVVFQLPFLDLLGSVSEKVFAMAVTVSILIMYSLTLLCGLYPSWLATRVAAADALRYE